MKKLIPLLVSLLIITSMAFTANAMPLIKCLPRNYKVAKNVKTNEKNPLLINVDSKFEICKMELDSSKLDSKGYNLTPLSSARRNKNFKKAKPFNSKSKQKNLKLKEDKPLMKDSENNTYIQWDIYSHRRETLGEDYKLIVDRIF